VGATMTLTCDAVKTALDRATPGQWFVADSCSFRRILQHGTDRSVIRAEVHSDGFPSLEGGRANLELAAMAPDLARAYLTEHARAEAAEAERDRLAERVAELEAANKERHEKLVISFQNLARGCYRDGLRAAAVDGSVVGRRMSEALTSLGFEGIPAADAESAAPVE